QSVVERQPESRIPGAKFAQQSRVRQPVLSHRQWSAIAPQDLGCRLWRELRITMKIRSELPTQRSAEDRDMAHVFNGSYQGDYLTQAGFPLGGIGAGMFCIEGTGAFSKFSLHHEPALTNEPLMFAALSVKGRKPFARVLEGPVPRYKLAPRFSVD